MDDSDDEILLLSAAVCSCLAMTLSQRKKKKRRRKIWVRTWLTRRHEYGAYHALLTELRKEDQQGFRNFLRMGFDQYQRVLEKVMLLIQKKNTFMRECIPAEERLAITLRFLASGDSFQSLEYLYRVARNILSAIVIETCAAIYDCLQPEYLRVPSSADEWLQIANDFRNKWQFPNCLGVVDGKHIQMRAPAKSGSIYYNYKHFYSIVLLAVVDASYRFVMFDLGTNGRVCDAAIYAKSEIYNRAFEMNTAKVPPPQPLPQRKREIPFVLIGDEAFALRPNFMRPYPARTLTDFERIFNYRLSRARRVSENAFGILVKRFTVLAKPMNLQPEKCEKVTKACLVLHNYLMSTNDKQYMMETDIHHTWSCDLNRQSGNKTSTLAREIREEICDYFNTNGQVEWQWDMALPVHQS